MASGTPASDTSDEKPAPSPTARVRNRQVSCGLTGASRPVLLGLVLVAVFGCLERLGADSAEHRAVLDLLGGHVQLAEGPRLACALDGHAAAAALLSVYTLNL